MYVYIQSEAGLFTVGFYDPLGKWHPDADFDTREAASERVAFLNGSVRRHFEATFTGVTLPAGAR